MKTYVITLSQAFPKTHSRAGQPTYFPALFRKKKIGKITGEVIWNQDDIKRPSGKLKLLSNNTIPLAYFSKAWNRSNDSIVVIGNINDNPELLNKEI